MKFRSDNIRGAAIMAVCMAFFVLNDTFMKLASSDFSLFQAMFLRGIVATMMIGMIAWYQKAFSHTISRKDRRILVIRIIGEIGATLTFLNALFHMPLANATAILQSLPLVITLSASLFLNEAVGWRRYLAILIGFTGVVIMVRPGSEGFNIYSFSAIAAVLFVTLRDLATRKLSPAIPSMLVSFWSAFMVMITGAILSPALDWKPVEASGLLLLVPAAIFIVFGYLFSVMAMRIGDISFISPFRYTILIWAIFLGYMVFGDIPDGWTLFGTLIIVATGIFTFHRERQIIAQGKLESQIV